MRFLKILLVIFLFKLTISCNNNEEIENQFQEHIVPVFVTKLFPVDNQMVLNNISNNVIQGIASFEDGWFVTQKYGNSILLINYLDSNGVSLFHKRLNINSHGQDLSIEQIGENELNLYTSIGSFGDNRNTGILKLHISLPEKINGLRNWGLTQIFYNEAYNLNYTNATPTFNQISQQFAIRSNKTILMHDKQAVDNHNFEALHSFELNTGQIKDNGNYSMYFQGIELLNEFVYCLAGNSKIGTIKNIYKYNMDGIVLKKYTFDRNDFNQNFYEKLEPEGLTIKNNHLFFTIMTKSQTEIGNNKYLYKIII